MAMYGALTQLRRMPRSSSPLAGERSVQRAQAGAALVAGPSKGPESIDLSARLAQAARFGHSFAQVQVGDFAKPGATAGIGGRAPGLLPSMGAVIQRVEWAKKIAYKAGDRIYGPGPYYHDAAAAVMKAKNTKGNQTQIQSFIDRILPTTEGEGYDKVVQAARSKDDEAFYAWFKKSPFWRKIGGQDPTKYDIAKLQQICKAGILFVTKKQGSTVHFILAGLLTEERMKEITGVSQGKGRVNRHGLANRTTFKELRSVYRNWSSIKKKVKFYDDNGDVLKKAPWEAGPFKGYWDQYARTRAERNQ